MKSRWILLLLTSLLACRENIKPACVEADAIITGIDARYCACCGGYMITFSGNPEPYQADFYQWENIGNLFPIAPTDSFPINVSICYEVDTTRCVASEGWLEIATLELQ